MTRESKEKLLEHLDALKDFPNNKLVRALKEQIQTKIERLEVTPVPISKNVNLSRSSKLKRYHKYIRLIRDNFPDLTHAEIRRQFVRRRNQEDVSIPDAVWQNPSP